MGTGTPVATTDIITAAKMNLKLETVEEANLTSTHPRLIERKVLAVAGTTFDFTGLDINTDHTYVMDIAAENNTASQTMIGLYVNNDTTPTNYYTQSVLGNSTSVSGERQNSGRVFIVNGSSFGIASIRVGLTVSGYAHALFACNIGSGSSLITFSGTTAKTSTVANITQLTLIADQNLKIGSSAALYALP